MVLIEAGYISMIGMVRLGYNEEAYLKQVMLLILTILAFQLLYQQMALSLP